MHWRILSCKLLLTILIPGCPAALFSQEDGHESVPSLRYEQNESLEWQEAIDYYAWLDEHYPQARLLEAGTTDAGKPLHLFIISVDELFSPEEARMAGKTVVFINNGIHPGEPCGVDASLKLVHGLLSEKDPYAVYLENTVLVIVPIFNVGGSLNRSPYHRANQNGPMEQGFRGNARNLDLNRDFIKLDTRNTRAMTRILRSWEPELFIDTHTSNGADYPYAITLINSHEQRHEPAQARFMREEVLPFLYEAMKESPYEMSPYVWSYRDTPEDGIIAFMDYPRYTSGYASMYNSLAFTVETHMFKPFLDRVLSTWHLLREMTRLASQHAGGLREARALAWQEKLAREEFTLRWELDTTRFDTISFRGYAAKWKASELTGHQRLWYDRSEEWEMDIPYYRYFRSLKQIRVPDYYILSAAYGEVVERLKINGVKMAPFERDSLMELEVSYIRDFKTSRGPYNGHYWHYDVQTEQRMEEVQLMAGDWLIPVRQKAMEYLVQCLEPEGYDSFFSWNFFDEILSRKEYFSSYIFEETALDLLQGDSALSRAFREKQENDLEFAASPRAQLRFIYEHSPWSEATYRRYPVYRIREGNASF